MMKKSFELKELPSWQDMQYKAVLYGLEGCAVFKMLDDDTKKKEWNGIGPNRMPKWLRDFLDTLHPEVLPAACIHDFDYVVGGTREMFFEANARLERNMKKCLKANRNDFSWFGYQIAKFRVKIAKMICDIYGYEGWNEHEEN